MQHIETIELGSTQSSITFSSIPQDYDDLVALVAIKSGRTNSAADGLNVQINGSDANMSFVRLLGDGSSASSSSGSDGDIANITAVPAGSTFGNTQLYFSNYTSTSDISISVDTTSENNGTSTRTGIYAALYSGGSAITSLEFSATNDPNIEAGSLVSLYGVTSGGSGTVTTS